jgi:hypothetical protein
MSLDTESLAWHVLEAAGATIGPLISAKVVEVLSRKEGLGVQVMVRLTRLRTLLVISVHSTLSVECGHRFDLRSDRASKLRDFDSLLQEYL